MILFHFSMKIPLSNRNSPRWDAMFCGVTSGAILFACHVKRTLGLYKLSRMMGLGRAFNHKNDAILALRL